MKLSVFCGISVDGFLARPATRSIFCALVSRSRTVSRNSIAASMSS